MMSVMVDWGDADEIILIWKFDKEWAWSDARYALNQSKHLVGSTAQDVVLIVDLRFAQTHPKGMLHYFPELIKQLPPEICRVVFLDKGTIFYSLFQMLKFQYPLLMNKSRLVDSVDDAYDSVNEVVTHAI